MKQQPHLLIATLEENCTSTRTYPSFEPSDEDSPEAAVHEVVHDLNNLLMMVSGHAELALYDLPDSSPAYEAMRSVRDAIWEAQIFTKALLGDKGDEKASTNLNEVVHTILALFLPTVQPAIRVDLRLGDALPPARIDPTIAHRILLNLVLNASEAIGESEGTITIQTTLERPNNRTGQPATKPAVCLLVADTGSGMDEATLSRIRHERFSHKGQERGHGLRVVHRAAQKAGGTLAIRSTLGIGSEFALLLPTASNTQMTRESKSTLTSEPLSRAVGS